MLKGTVSDWLDLEKFLKRREIKYSSIISSFYRSQLAVAWAMEQFQKGKIINQSLEQIMESIEAKVDETPELKKHIENVSTVLDTDLPESEILPLHNWYVARKKAREEEYDADLEEKLRKAVKRLLGLSYEELVPFRVLVTGDGTFVTLVWDILTNSEMNEQEKKKLVRIAGKKGLTREESRLVIEYSDKSRLHIVHT